MINLVEFEKPYFEVGAIYKRNELHDMYGGQRQYGISTPSGKSYVFLFTGPSGSEHGYKDGWIRPGVYQYTGEGQVGDMVLTRGNKAIMDHLTNCKDLHLFEQIGGGQVQYVGQMAYRSHEIRDSDFKGTKRKIVVFELTLI